MVDYWAQKQIIVQRPGWTALVGFCGIAHTGRRYVPDWIVERLHEIGPGAGFEALVDGLTSADTWLGRWPASLRAITFSIGAFVDLKPLFVLISNFEALGRPPGPTLTRFPSSLEVTRYRPRKEQLFLSGRPHAVLSEERLALIGTFRKRPTPERGYAALAEVNRRAAARDTSVGPACFTSHLTVLGDSGGMVHGWPPDRDFLPAFVDVDGVILPRIRRGTDEQGRPKPLQMVQALFATVTPSRRYFRIALEERPSDPSILSNYGNWLKEHGQMTEAESAYRRAVESDPSFAAAHGNLALLLDRRGAFDAAEDEYRRAAELDDQSPLWLLNLAFFLWFRRSQVGEADALFQQAVSLQRTAFTLSRQAWFTELAFDDPDTAAALYAEALQMAPTDPWVNGRFAIFLRSQDDVAAARERFNLAVAGDKPEHDWLVAYALLEAQEGSLETAHSLLERAVRLYPRSPDALALLAAVRSQTGEGEADVERMYRRALELRPDHATAALNLAQLLLRRNASDQEARRLLATVADRADLADEARMELLFYGFAYLVPGFEQGDAEIASLAADGVRLVGWDLSEDVAAAERVGHPRADRVHELAEMIADDE